jgi:hypothetical protein
VLLSLLVEGVTTAAAACTRDTVLLLALLVVVRHIRYYNTLLVESPSTALAITVSCLLPVCRYWQRIMLLMLVAAARTKHQCTQHCRCYYHL